MYFLKNQNLIIIYCYGIYLTFFILKLQVKMLTFFNFSSLTIRNHSFSSSLLLQFFCQFSKHYGKLGTKGVTKYEKFYVFKGFVCY
ncbi:hypothetical protein CUS07_01370 [Enterococcus faecalis]|nr:hypothetical protein CUS33_06875 [Enterococcus faecalis]PQE61562.1 hypothetical protein CUS07_01370 [Enterococcus faecalis]PQE66606.1 hypothetical protein CUS03_07460 [Enterococcus faecalis]PQF01373.1 hypothetical protein CUS90_01430 [Enterococcus faecalis]PQF57647.1 hypothetical protein CUS66_01525 [Enterococcus faecalis]